MPNLSSVAVGMPTSGIREIRDLANTLDGVIHLEIGEPDFETPADITQRAFQAARDGYTRYTTSSGIPSLREALAEKLRTRNGIEAEPGRIVVSTGAAGALCSSILAAVNPGDEVLVPDPGWPNYIAMVQLAGGTAVPYPQPRTNGFVPDIEVVRSLIGPKTKALIINNPGNPTGAVYPPEVVRGIVDLAAEHDLFLIADEVYEDFVFDGEHRAAAAFGYPEGIFSVFSFSKTYAMTGWRIGYLVVPPGVASAVANVQATMVSCVSSVSQKAAEAALLLDASSYGAMREAYRIRRDMVVDILEDCLVTTPGGAFYALVDLSPVTLDTYALAKNLLVEERVATAPGETFGAQCMGMVRISLAASEEDLAEGCRRIVRYRSGQGR